VRKRLEWLAKNALAVLVAVLCWRPGRAARARRLLPTLRAGRVLLVRVDNRVGEALLTTPVIDALAARGFTVEVLVHPRVRRVLEGHPRLSRLWTFEKNLKTLRALRAQAFDVVVNCGNWELESVTTAIVARLAGPRSIVLGPANFPSGLLMDVPVQALAGTSSEALQRTHLVAALTGEVPVAKLSFRPVPPSTLAPPGAYCVVNPGGRLGYRRVPAAVFALAARLALAHGLTPVVTWGPGEEALADEVLAGAPGALRAPPTDLDQLAALMRGARVTICNNTGPMHLSVAVGSPTIAFFFRMEPERWGHAFAPHQMLELTPTLEAGGSCEALVSRALSVALERSPSR